MTADTGVHKARDVVKGSDPGERGAYGTCAVCKEQLRAVPGGRGPVWVHLATGLVVSGGVDPENPIRTPPPRKRFVFEIDVEHSAAFEPHYTAEVRRMIRTLASVPHLSDPSGRIIDSEGHGSGRWHWKE